MVLLSALNINTSDIITPFLLTTSKYGRLPSSKQPFIRSVCHWLTAATEYCLSSGGRMKTMAVIGWVKIYLRCSYTRNQTFPCYSHKVCLKWCWSLVVLSPNCLFRYYIVLSETKQTIKLFMGNVVNVQVKFICDSNLVEQECQTLRPAGFSRNPAYLMLINWIKGV